MKAVDYWNRVLIMFQNCHFEKRNTLEHRKYHSIVCIFTIETIYTVIQLIVDGGMLFDDVYSEYAAYDELTAWMWYFIIKSHVHGFFDTDLHEVSWHFTTHATVRLGGF